MSHRQNFTDDYEFEVYKTSGGGYSVSLPHQCDSWEIIGADGEQTLESDDSYPAHPLSKVLAVKQMELFIQRATEALEKLKTL